MTTLTGYRLDSDTGSAGPSSGDQFSGGGNTTNIDTSTTSPTNRATVNYPSLGPVDGYVFFSGGEYYFVPDDAAGFPPNETGTLITTEDAATDTGSGGDDSYSGDVGDNSYDGQQGDDTVLAADGADTIHGDSGNDSLHAGMGDDIVYGGDGSDTIEGDQGNDFIDGGAGNDSILAGLGDDTVNGGLGDDTIFAQGDNDTVGGGDGNDFVDAGTGDDLVLGDGHWFDPADYASGELTEATTLNVTNSSGTQIELWFIDETGTLVYGSTINDGDTLNQPTFIDDNWVLRSTDGTNLQLIEGGNQTVDFGAGGLNDSLEGRAGDDFLRGMMGDDTLMGNNDNDTLEGGAGNDSLHGGGQTDTALFQGSLTDYSFDLVSGNVVVTDMVGDGGSDTLRLIEQIQFDEGVWDLIIGSDSNNNITPLDTFQDFILSFDGNDTATGTSSDDVFIGGSGTDVFDGDAGDDTIVGNGGSDTLQGEGGNDTFVYRAGDGDDYIIDFNTGNTGTLSDGDSSNNDFIDLTAFYDNLSELYADQLDDGVLNQSNTLDTIGRSVDYSNNDDFGTGSLTFTGASGDSSFFTSENTGVVCFAAGSAIRTPYGDVLVEDLKPGDLVTTMDNGPQRIVWIGARTFDAAGLMANPKRLPILIKRGCLGAERDLLVSRQHAVLVEDVLVRAIKLVDRPGIRVARGKRSVTYYHVMFDRHQVIFAENVASESFYPGPWGLRALSPSAKADLFAHYPELKAGVAPHQIAKLYGQKARPAL